LTSKGADAEAKDVDGLRAPCIDDALGHGVTQGRTPLSTIHSPTHP
jgi:hypothetical protein